jgi:hypothetical protein
MKKFLTILFFLPLLVNAQTIDTLPNARAYQPNFLALTQFGLTYLQAGMTTENHVWMAGFNLVDSAGYAKPFELVRIDCNTHVVTTKTIPNTYSSNSMLWLNFFDSLGNLYIGLNSGNRKIYKFNFKDSIYSEYLDSGFLLANVLMYSGSLGRDNHVYFGGSSGGTFWSEYDPYNDVLTKHPEVDEQQGYVLSIQGDSDWVYAQVGQNTWIKYWAIRKSDNYKVVIDSIPSSGRFNTATKKDGCYYSDQLGQLYRMNGETRIPVASTVSPNIEYHEVGNDQTYGSIPGRPMVSSYFDNTSNLLYYNIAGVPDSVAITTPWKLNSIRRSWVDNSTGDNIYFGEYYGNTYKNDTMHTLGYIGFNTYSHVQVNDSIIYFGGYPSGVVAKYNKNQPWTAQKYINGSVKALSATTNPALVTYFKSGTDAGFHHTEIMVNTDDGYIVAGGTVIRIANTSSVGALNISTGIATGYDYNKMVDYTYITDIAIWRNYALVAVYGGAQKIYVYDYKNNVMVDSISFGWTGYGKLYVIGDKLIGVSSSHIYNYNLAEKVLVKSYAYPDNSISYSYMMPDGRVLITSTGGIVLPTDMCVNFIPYSVSTGEISVYQDKLFTYTGWNVLRLNNYFKTDANIDTPQGVTDMIKRKLKMIQ